MTATYEGKLLASTLGKAWPSLAKDLPTGIKQPPPSRSIMQVDVTRKQTSY